jgi:hypothetical protein
MLKQYATVLKFDHKGRPVEEFRLHFELEENMSFFDWSTLRQNIFRELHENYYKTWTSLCREWSENDDDMKGAVLVRCPIKETDEKIFSTLPKLPIPNSKKNAGAKIKTTKASTKSGIKGVIPNGKSWTAKGYRNRKQHYLGTFKTIEEARQAVLDFGKTPV